METVSWMALVSRWIHLLSVIVAVGGTFFMRLVLAPSAKSSLDEATHKRLLTAVISRWRLVVHSCVGLLLLTGTYNMIIAIRTGVSPAYHSLLGVKLILALAIFFFAIMLTSSRELEWVNRRRGTWLALVIAMGIGVVMISGILKNMPHGS